MRLPVALGFSTAPEAPDDAWEMLKLLPKLNVFTQTSGQSNRRIKWSYESKAKSKVLKHFQTILIIHGFFMCKFTYSLKSICNLKVNTRGTPVIVHRLGLSSKIFHALLQLSYCKPCPSGNLWSAAFLTFLCFLLVILLLKVVPGKVLKGRLLFPSTKNRGALGRKGVCRLSFVHAWLTVLVAESSMPESQQHIK